MSRPEVPTQFHEFDCAEYFREAAFRSGFLDFASQTQLVFPEEELQLLPEAEFMVIGSPGISSVLFGFRKHHSGVWAYYPIDGDFKFMAGSIKGLVEGWLNESLFV